MIIETTADLIESHYHQSYITHKIGDRPIGLTLNEDVNLATAEKVLRQRLLNREGEQWEYGDFVNQSTLKFGEAAAQIIPSEDEIQFNNAYQKLAKWSSIASRYTLEERIYPLSFSHYQECAYIQNKAARAELLQWCVDNQASTKELRDERNRRYPDAHKGLQWISDDNTPNLADTSHSIELDTDIVNQIRLGNLRGVMAIFKSWRGIVQAGKKYRVILQEVND